MGSIDQPIDIKKGLATYELGRRFPVLSHDQRLTSASLIGVSLHQVTRTGIARHNSQIDHTFKSCPSGLGTHFIIRVRSRFPAGAGTIDFTLKATTELARTLIGRRGRHRSVRGISCGCRAARELYTWGCRRRGGRMFSRNGPWEGHKIILRRPWLIRITWYIHPISMRPCPRTIPP